MAEDGNAGTYGGHGRFAEGVARNCSPFGYFPWKYTGHVTPRLVLYVAPCLSLLSYPVYSHELPAADKTDNTSIGYVSVVIFLGPCANRAPTVDVPFTVLMQVSLQADLSSIVPLRLYLYYQLGAMPCRKFDLRTTLADPRTHSFKMMGIHCFGRASYVS